ncbi:UDP-N-acetylglucosamine 1-carboxyvinyltransferase [Catellatospora chokoriensis]|uniref:UDP-N-acetylglucosamine 1-carboxyvinyltransferase n=1 Tax=Catellatospora chokoriensis TaxID=310353 RepID=A0A8J3JSD5_9ACTN|nr:UDP-N-acetylglucosamine 1-carboxyvinyltransferase [Catellatospora chokoriensis]GIF87659.1 UDP-N-acetylglucosamine 1-carboxyvinyltransferase [Catellatospora chokoriensis]
MNSIRYRVGGGHALAGTAIVQGAKNAVLPLIAAALLAERGVTVLHNVPDIEDVHCARKLAEAVGARVEFHRSQGMMVIDASTVSSSVLPQELSGAFRGTVFFLPVLLARTGRVVCEGVGGCSIGNRPLNYSYRAYERMGARVREFPDRVEITAGKLAACALYLDTPSHTGTENLMLAAAAARGRTTIENAAVEPEVGHLAGFLTAMGGGVSGTGTRKLTVEGATGLTGVDWRIMPDRIDAGFLIMAAAITGGGMTLAGAEFDDLGAARFKLDELGVGLERDGGVLRVSGDRPLSPVDVVTDPHPGFATDLQSPLLALATRADGESRIHERVHSSRFAVVEQLRKMGADITVAGSTAVVRGRSTLIAAEVDIPDLRGGTALLLAALAAEGETVLSGARMLDRGHARLVERLCGLGAKVVREVVDA